jgi:hypothetical protein
MANGRKPITAVILPQYATAVRGTAVILSRRRRIAVFVFAVAFCPKRKMTGSAIANPVIFIFPQQPLR